MESRATCFAFSFYEYVELEFKGGGGTKPKPNKLTKSLHTSAVFRSYKLLPIKNTLKLNTQGL